MFGRVLACVDGSPNGRRALETGLEVAVRFGGGLVALTVLPTGPDAPDRILENLVPTDDGTPLHRTMVQAVERARERGMAESEAVFLRGRPADAILEYLRTHPIELVVVGTRGLSRGSRLLMGSLSSRLVAEAPCPVLVVRPVGRNVRAAAPSV